MSLGKTTQDCAPISILAHVSTPIVGDADDPEAVVTFDGFVVPRVREPTLTLDYVEQATVNVFEANPS